MSDLSDKLKIGKHYSMERFGIMTAMALVLVFGLVAWGGVNTYRENHARELTQVIYEGEFTTSASGAPGRLLGVFENGERTDAALLFRFQDMSSLSNQASDYTAMVRGMKDEMTLRETRQPITKGSCTVYGSSGYMVVTLHSERPFERELLQVMVGDDNPKIPESRQTGDEPRGQVFDIWYCIVNLGGDGAFSTLSFGEDGTFDASGFFQEIVAASEEQAIVGDLDADLREMSEILDNIETLERRAQGDGIKVDDFRPAWVDGDSVESLVKADYLNGDEGGKDRSDSWSRGKYALRTTTVALGGFDFDWQSYSLSDGYISRLAYAAGFDDVSEYLSAQIETQQPWVYEVPKWALPDGTVIVRDEKVSVSSSMQDLAEDVGALDEAYSAYAAAKSKYQIDDLTRLLQLEVDASDRGSVFTSNSEDFLALVE